MKIVKCLGKIKATHGHSISEEQLRALKKPLPAGISTRLFCTACGMLSYLGFEESFLVLMNVPREDLAIMIDWKKNYIEGNSCFLCDSEKKNFRIIKI